MIALRSAELASAGRSAPSRFAPDGHMCFSAMRRTRSKLGGPGPQAGTPDETAAAYDGYIGYCGRYNVNEEERSVTFQLELSSYSNWTGSSQSASSK
jgi:hypothetical protein